MSVRKDCNRRGPQNKSPLILALVGVLLHGPLHAAGDNQQIAESSESLSYFQKTNGRIQFDGWRSHGGSSQSRYPDGTETRRFVLGVQGQLSSRLKYVANVDFGQEEADFEDVYIQFAARPGLALNFGHHEASVSFEDETSDANMSFMERSPYNALSLGRSVGFSTFAWGQHWSIKAGVFGQADTSDPLSDFDESCRAAFRAAWVPRNSDGRLLHLGTSVYHRDFSAAQAQYRIKVSPESRLIPPLVDTGQLQARGIDFFGVEAVGVHGSLSWQAEWGRQQLDLRQQRGSVIQAGYVQLSWFPTGETRPYDIIKGKFTAVHPAEAVKSGGRGAVELAVRISRVDLQDHSLAGGRQAIWTLALNWYLTSHFRAQLNWADFRVRDSRATTPLGQPDHDGRVAGMRLQATW